MISEDFFFLVISCHFSLKEENPNETFGGRRCFSAWCPAAVSRSRPLLDVLLRLVVLLGQVFSRGLAGDLDEGQLLVVAGHVARRLAHAEVVVPLHQEICRGQSSDISV